MGVYVRLPKFIATQTGLTCTERTMLHDYPMHWHDFYEIEYILSGSCSYYINGVEYSANAGSLFFITPIDFQHVDVHEKTVLVNIMFTDEWIDDELMDYLIYPTVFEKYDFAFNDILHREIERKDKFNALYVKYILNCILADIVREIQKKIRL